jgi:hypothetical protein
LLPAASHPTDLDAVEEWEFVSYRRVLFVKLFCFFLSAVTPFFLSGRSNLRRDVTIWDCTTDLFDVLKRTALFDEADGYASSSIDFSIKFSTGG